MGIARLFPLFPLFLFGAFSLTSCSRILKNPQKVPVLIINGDTYTAQDFGRDLAKKLKNFDALAAKDPINVSRAKEAVLREFIVSTLLSQYAKAHQIFVNSSELSDEFDSVRKTYPDDLTFRAALASEGQSLDEWKERLKTSLLEKKVFADLDPESAKESSPELNERARAYYAAHKSLYDRPAQIHLLQIIVPKEDDAERLLHKLKAGASFSELAKKFSISPDATKGGDVGYISKGVVPAFDTAFSMKPGQISNVVKSSYGFHIMKVLDKRGAGAEPYEQVKKGIIHRLAAQQQQEVFSKWIDGAIKAAKTQRNDALIDKIKIRTEGAQE